MNGDGCEIAGARADAGCCSQPMALRCPRRPSQRPATRARWVGQGTHALRNLEIIASHHGNAEPRHFTFRRRQGAPATHLRDTDRRARAVQAQGAGRGVGPERSSGLCILEIGRSNWARSDCGRKKHVVLHACGWGGDVEDPSIHLRSRPSAVFFTLAMGGLSVPGPGPGPGGKKRLLGGCLSSRSGILKPAMCLSGREGARPTQQHSGRVIINRTFAVLSNPVGLATALVMTHPGRGRNLTARRRTNGPAQLAGAVGD